MITLRFGPAALAHVRFAISPLVEVRRSRRLLEDPAAGALHLPWVVQTRKLTADLDLLAVQQQQATQSIALEALLGNTELGDTAHPVSAQASTP